MTDIQFKPQIMLYVALMYKNQKVVKYSALINQINGACLMFIVQCFMGLTIQPPFF